MDFLISMGFLETDVKAALDNSNQDVDIALTKLLSNDKTPSTSNSSVNLRNVLQLPVSQYDIGGSSSCTSIACSVTCAILRKLSLDENIESSDWLVENVFLGNQKHQLRLQLSKSLYTIEHTSIEEYFTGNVEDGIVTVNEVPLQQMIHSQVFSDMIGEATRELYGRDMKSIGVIFTKPPESAAVIIYKREQSLIYYFFDSHSRPQFDIQGAYLYRTQDPQELASYLSKLFSVADLKSASNPYVNVNVEEMMYNTVEYVFIGTRAEEDDPK